jgi:hypothetical protein
MRLRTCLGALLLGPSACVGLPNTIPGAVRIDVDGSVLEFKKKPEPPAPAAPPAPQPPPPAAAADAPQR